MIFVVMTYLNPRTAPARAANGIAANNVTFPFLSWGALMQHNHKNYGEKTWMIYHAEQQRHVWSYAVFIETAQRLATVLKNRGVTRGNRVAIASHNHPDTILGYFACWLIGACAVPLNMTEDDSRLQYILGACGCTLTLCRTEYLERISPYAHNLLEMDSHLSNSVFYSEIRTSETTDFPSASEDYLFDECLLVYTSGTTGNPKGVVLIQQNLFADGLAISQWHGISEDTRMMCVLPVHHVNGTIVTHVTPFISGSSIVLVRKFSASSFFSHIVNEQVHIVSVVPTLLAILCEAKSSAQGVLEGGFRHVICGAGPLTCDLTERFLHNYAIPIIHGYGLSETTCYSCFIPTTLNKDEQRHWLLNYGFPSIGIALPCNEMAIHNEHGEPVGEYERGEIVCRGSNVMKCYDANPTANEECFAFGWFRSGDEGFYVNDASGVPYYFITGRLKELIIRGGVNLAPLEIDEVIGRAPGVRAGICVGFEHNVYGEEIGALIVPENADVQAEDILQYCKQHLPNSKAPKIVLFAEELPVTSTGKYQRNKVKHLFAAYKDIKFN